MNILQSYPIIKFLTQEIGPSMHARRAPAAPCGGAPEPGCATALRPGEREETPRASAVGPNWSDGQMPSTERLFASASPTCPDGPKSSVGERAVGLPSAPARRRARGARAARDGVLRLTLVAGKRVARPVHDRGGPEVREPWAITSPGLRHEHHWISFGRHISAMV